MFPASFIKKFYPQWLSYQFAVQCNDLIHLFGERIVLNYKCPCPFALIEIGSGIFV